ARCSPWTGDGVSTDRSASTNGTWKERPEVNMAVTREDDKPWKTDLARKSAQRREQVIHEVEETIKKAASFEDALKQSAELLKKRFARFSAVSVYVADGEDLALHTTVERPTGPDRLGAGGHPLAGDADSRGGGAVSH